MGYNPLLQTRGELSNIQNHAGFWCNARGVVLLMQNEILVEDTVGVNDRTLDWGTGAGPAETGFTGWWGFRSQPNSVGALS